MAERVWRSEDDNRAARPPHSPLRPRRDRQRKLALQEPRLTREQSQLKRTALAPAAQPRPYVDGPLASSFSATPLWRLRSYVRPVDAKPKLAGHDVSASSGFSSAPRARSAGRGTECPGRRFAGSSSPHCALAKLVTQVRCNLGRMSLITLRRRALLGGTVRRSS